MPIQNPVITPIGVSYEKDAIEKWITIKKVEPQSKKLLKKDDLLHNLTLKGVISKIYREVPKIEKILR
jgi:hypothetical protein